MTTISFADLPTPGAAFAAGIFRGLVTQKDGTYTAVVELPARSLSRLNKPMALDWAASVDGRLPSRAEGLLLYSQAKASFDPTTYWTRDLLSDDIEGAPAYNWAVGMDGGGLNYHPDEVALAVIAVQLVPVVA